MIKRESIMKIKDNVINPPPQTLLIDHDMKQLCGKPKGTYFFRETKGSTVMVFCAGGPKIGELNLVLESDGKINIKDRIAGNDKLSFASETKFFSYLEENGFVSPSFPKERFYLTKSVNEHNALIPSLKHLAAVSIFKNPILNTQFWNGEFEISEEVEEFLLDINKQMDASKYSN